MNLATDGFGNGTKAADNWAVDGFVVGPPIIVIPSDAAVGCLPDRLRVGELPARARVGETDHRGLCE